MSAPPLDLITPAEAAGLLRCSRATVYRLLAGGGLTPYRRKGSSRVLLSRGAALGLIEEGRVGKSKAAAPESGRARTARDRRTEEVLRKAGLLE